MGRVVVEESRWTEEREIKPATVALMWLVLLSTQQINVISTYILLLNAIQLDVSKGSDRIYKV